MSVSDTIVSRLRYWCQLVLPAVYDDSLSYYELLAKVTAKINEVIDSNNELAGYVAQNTEDIAVLKEEFQKFKDGDYDYIIEEAVAKWLDVHMEALIKQSLLIGLWFGLTSDGYFCAYKPESWTDVDFDTGEIYGRSDYGRLILRTSVEGEGVINNTYSYSLNADPEKIDTLIADLEVNARRTDAVFNTLYTDLDKEIVQGGENA